MSPPNGWDAWGKHVLLELERENGLIEELRKAVAHIQSDVHLLQWKAGVWGLLGGLIPISIIIVLWLVKR